MWKGKGSALKIAEPKRNSYGLKNGVGIHTSFKHLSDPLTNWVFRTEWLGFVLNSPLQHLLPLHLLNLQTASATSALVASAACVLTNSNNNTKGTLPKLACIFAYD